MSHPSPDPREVPLEGSLNFRDLGGLETRSGTRIRSRRIFRSDALHRITERDLATLAGFGITTLIDLRGRDESERTGPSPLLGHGTRVAQVALLDPVTQTTAPDFTIALDIDYARMLNHAQAGFSRAFVALAEETNLPAVIHCASGKDRTGVTVALLLRVLDVPDEAIVRDYAITDRNMARILARDPVNAERFPEHWHRAASETMFRFLAALDAQYGSAVDYLTNAGVPASQLATIRHRLLDTA